MTSMETPTPDHPTATGAAPERVDLVGETVERIDAGLFHFHATQPDSVVGRGWQLVGPDGHYLGPASWRETDARAFAALAQQPTGGTADGLAEVERLVRCVDTAAWNSAMASEQSDNEAEEIVREKAIVDALRAVRELARLHAPAGAASGVVAIPEGYKLVPSNPTPAMLRAGGGMMPGSKRDERGASVVWCFMWDAAPVQIAAAPKASPVAALGPEGVAVRDMVVAYAYRTCSAAAYPNTSIEQRWLRDRWLVALDALGMTEDQARAECRAAMRGIYTLRPSRAEGEARS